MKLKLEGEQNKRSGNINGIENLLLGFLESRNIKKQHFHGGSMNGVCCRRLLDNVDGIFEDIVVSMVKDKVYKDDKKNEQDLEKLTGFVSMFKALFECMDLVLSKLRILDPSDEEIKEIEQAIRALEGLWLDLDLNITPKMHILKHVIHWIRLKRLVVLRTKLRIS